MFWAEPTNLRLVSAKFGVVDQIQAALTDWEGSTRFGVASEQVGAASTNLWLVLTGFEAVLTTFWIGYDPGWEGIDQHSVDLSMFALVSAKFQFCMDQG